MAGRKAAKQAPPKLDEDDDTEGWEDAVVETESEQEADLRMRDWRDVERYREMRELRRLVDDDYGLEEIFRIPVRTRAEPGSTPRSGKAAKTPPKPAPTAKAAKPASKAPTSRKTPPKAAPSLKAKAKRR